MHLLFQTLKKNIVWGRYIDWDKRHFFPLHGQLTLFNQKSSSHTCLMWNVANFMTDEV